MTKIDKRTNPDGTVTVSIGDTLKEVKKIADAERRSMSKQIEVIIREWLASHKSPPPAARGAA